jgi:hypothetical protein
MRACELPLGLLQRSGTVRRRNVDHRVRRGWQSLRHLLHWLDVQQRRMLVRRGCMYRVLLERDMHDPVDDDLRGQRRDLQGVQFGPELHRARAVPLRCRVVPEWMLRREQLLPDVEQLHMRHGWSALPGLRPRGQLRVEQLCVQREQLPERLLLGGGVCAVFVAKQRHLRPRRSVVRRVRLRATMQRELGDVRG